MAITLDEKSPIIVLEVNNNKINTEVVGWYTLDERNLQRIKRQAEREGGELLMLSPNDKVESLSTPTSVLPTRKDTNISINVFDSTEKFSIHRNKQLDIIKNANSMRDNIHVGIRSVEDIKTFDA